MSRDQRQSVHLLEIPTARLPLLTPSATVAEVVNFKEIGPLPLSPDWVIGVLGWRAHAVPVVSFEALLAGVPPPSGARAKVIVFYPLPGRAKGEFFGILSTREPVPRVFDEATGLVPNPAGPVESAFVAATVRLGEKTLLIPDFEALKKAFYL